MNEHTGGKERAITIDEVPLEWCFQSGVTLDFRHFPDGYVVTAGDIEAELEHIGHTLSPLEIVLVNTAAGGAYGDSDFVSRGCGVGYEGTMYLLEQGVRVTGTDAWSWDAPFDQTAARLPRPVMPVSSGKAIRRVAISAIVTWKSYTTLSRCPALVSLSVASRTKFAADPLAGPAQWR
jgi:kynurenine formamidase